MRDTDPPTGWEQPVADRDSRNLLATIEDTLLRIERLLIEKAAATGPPWDQLEPAQSAPEARPDPPDKRPRRGGRPKVPRRTARK
jgi:hypothetical protein